MKYTRWLILKNYINLNKEKNEKQRLDAALAMNEPLYKAYYLKEEFKLLWLQPNQEMCINFMGEWIAKAKSTGIKQLEKFCDMLINHCDGILNWYNYKISSGPLEGLNNKIKAHRYFQWVS